MEPTRDRNAARALEACRIVLDVADEYGPLLLRHAMAAHGESVRRRDGSRAFRSEVDLRIDREYRHRFGALFDAFVYLSEEAQPEVVGSSSWPPVLLVVDPLDSSELAVRGLAAYTHVFAYSLAERAPLFSVVGDLFHEARLFFAYRDETGADRAYMTTRGGETLPIRPSDEVRLANALVTTYSLRPLERFRPVARQERLLEAIAGTDEGTGRIGVDYGSIGLCHVAAGFSDAMLEISKGFHVWDVAPGSYVLEAAGGVLRSLDGGPLAIDLDVESLSHAREKLRERHRFVAAATEPLLEEILDSLVEQPAT